MRGGSEPKDAHPGIGWTAVYAPGLAARFRAALARPGSGSQALHRRAETKGAVELLLADGYVRRDRVAVVAFRGSQAQLLLSQGSAPDGR